MGKAAMARIADLVGRGAAPARMQREVEAIVAGMLAGDEDRREAVKQVIEELRDDMLAGVADTAAMLEDIEHPDAASARNADKTLAAMQAAADALVEACAGL
ncbi:hypothetical protein ACFQY5_27375 [Paeniroseomonas aquatica]